jgi:hypothetical protein
VGAPGQRTDERTRVSVLSAFFGVDYSKVLEWINDVEYIDYSVKDIVNISHDEDRNRFELTFRAFKVLLVGRFDNPLSG